MRKLMSAFVGFCLLNVFVVAPSFFLFTSDLADYLVLDLETEKPVSVCSTCLPDGQQNPMSRHDLNTAYCEGAIGRSSKVRMWLPGGCHRDRLCLEFSDATGPVFIRSAKLYHRFVLAWKIDFVNCSLDNHEIKDDSYELCDKRGALVKIKDGRSAPICLSRECKWKQCSLTDKYVVGVIVLVESFALMASLLFAFFTVENKDTAQIVRRAAIIAGFASVFYCLILPCQSFLVNESMFNFGLQALMCQGCFSLAIVFLVLAIGLICFDRMWGGVVSVALTFFLIYQYLETGFFSFGDAQLNGEIGGFLNGQRMLWDSGVLLVLLILAIIFYRRLYRYIHWIALSFFALAILSLCDVKKEQRAKNSESIVSTFGSRRGVANAARFSEKRNVLVFVLDMATTEVALDVMRRDEGLRKKFSGFTCFRNNIGMHMYTPQGTAGIFTGQYLADPSKLMEYIGTKFSSQSFIKQYLERDVPMYIMPGDLNYAYSNRFATREKLEEEVGSSDDNPFYSRIQGTLKWNLFEIIALRCAPYVIRSKVMEIAMLSWPTAAGLSSEEELYSVLKSQIKTCACDLTLHYYHTDGAHEPLTVDRDGHKFEKARFDYDAYLNKFWFALKNLGELLDELRTSRLYDNSLILVCSDHGCGHTNGNAMIKNGMPNTALPFLWFKPEGASGEFVIDDTPTSHVNISRVMKQACRGPLTRDSIVRILRCEDRFYRRITGSEIVDYHADATGAVRIVKSKVVQNPKELRCVNIGERYSFHADKVNKLDFLCEGLESDFIIPRMMPSVNKMSVRIRVTDPLKLYNVSLGVSLYAHSNNKIDGSSGVFFSVGESSVSEKLIFHSNQASIFFPKTMPDRNGIISIEGERVGAANAIFFDDIKITEAE